MSASSASTGHAPPPNAALDISAARVTAAAVTSRGGQVVVSAYASEALPDGALAPSLVGQNLKDRTAVKAAVQRVLQQIGRPRRIGLVIPDPAAKISLLHFQQVPARAQELEQLIRFQVKKSAPFPVDDAQVAFVPGARSADGTDFLVSVARRETVLEYESLCTELGAAPGIVDIHTFNVANAVLGGSHRPAGDWLLVNVAPDWAAVVAGRGDDVILYRSRTAESEGTLLDLVHQSTMYYEDRLSGTGFERVLVCGSVQAGAAAAAGTESLRRAVAERLHTAVTVVDPRDAATLGEGVATAASLDGLTALVGLLVRDRKAAA